jgi:adenosylcobinamide-phosphate synthase
MYFCIVDRKARVLDARAMLMVWLTGAGTGADVFYLAVLALLFDLVLGDPEDLYRRVPHPVALIGRAIAVGERWLHAPDGAFRRGLMLTMGLVGLAIAVGTALAMILRPLPGGWLIAALLASTLIACRSLHRHGAAVADGLDLSLPEGQAAVAKIVGRDPESLDRAGVARAAIESIAENFSDGVVAPLFWLVVLGLPGLFAYKAINTLDSMIGYRNARYEHFGRAAARLDDWVNWIPARLAGILLIVAAVFVPGADGARAWRGMRRDAPCHRSPNAGWQEAAVAGALGLALAGPRQYGAQIVDDAWMGDGRRDADAADIRAALALYRWATAVLGLGIGVAWLIF